MKLIKKLRNERARLLLPSGTIPLKRSLFGRTSISPKPSRQNSFPQTRPKPKLHSLKFEISILYTFILGVILIIFSSVLYIILFYTSNNEIDNELKWKAQQINQSIRSYLDIQGDDPQGLLFAAQKTITGAGKDPKKWWSRLHESRWLKRVNQLDFSENYINFVSPNKESLIRSKSLYRSLMDFFLKAIPKSESIEVGFKDITYDHSRIRLLNFPFIYKTGPRYLIQVGISQRPSTQLLQNWLYSIAVSLPIILILTSFVGRIFTGRILDPVQKITTMAQRITHEDLSSRVQARYFDAEMNGLAQAFNDMISRLEQSFKHIEEFSSHVAHELKTPLSIIKGEAELALRKDQDPKEYRRVIKIHLQESERMIRTIEALLLLAKLDYRPEIFKFESVDFMEFFNEIYGQSRIVASRKNITVQMYAPQETIMVNADRMHLRRLFFNLIDNALKFTPNNGRVDLTIKPENKKVMVLISDTGIGIAPENLPRVFERFFRAENKEPGLGLGLNIAQTIVRIHKGEIKVESKPREGTTFKVILPCS